MMIRFHEITSPSYVNGPGKRVALHTVGCTIRCQGCQNQHLWPTGGDIGYLVSPQALAEILVETGLPITLTGGEPFDQPIDLYNLLRHIRHLDLHRHVIIYTGRTFEELVNTGRHEVLATLARADVLVDGPYIQSLDSPTMQYRGSSNQRAIDLQATLRRPIDTVMCKSPVLLDWNKTELILTENGDLLGTLPVAEEWVGGIGILKATRRCGEIYGPSKSMENEVTG